MKFINLDYKCELFFFLLCDYCTNFQYSSYCYITYIITSSSISPMSLNSRIRPFLQYFTPFSPLFPFQTSLSFYYIFFEFSEVLSKQRISRVCISIITSALHSFYFYNLFTKCLQISAPIKSHCTPVVQSLVRLSCRLRKRHLSFPPLKMGLVGANHHGLNRTSGFFSVHISMSSLFSCP